MIRLGKRIQSNNRKTAKKKPLMFNSGFFLDIFNQMVVLAHFEYVQCDARHAMHIGRLQYPLDMTFYVVDDNRTF